MGWEGYFERVVEDQSLEDENHLTIDALHLGHRLGPLVDKTEREVPLFLWFQVSELSKMDGSVSISSDPGLILGGRG